METALLPHAPDPELHLGLPGFRHADLHDAARLADLTRAFDDALRAADPALFARYDAQRAGTAKLTGPEESELLLQLAGHLSHFVGRLFGVEKELARLRETAGRDAPLFRAKRGKAETYIKDERELDAFLIKRATEARVVRIPSKALEISGSELEKLLHRMIAHQKLLQVVERRGHPREIVEALLGAGADREYFADKDKLEGVAHALTTDMRTVTVDRFTNKLNLNWRRYFDAIRNFYKETARE